VSEGKRTLKQRAFREVREYFAISLYLFVVFSMFVFYKAMLLAEQNVDFAPHGFVLINALALAEVILIAQDLHLADQFRDAPLIVPTLLKSFAFATVLTCFKFAEETAIGVFHGQFASRKRLRYRRWTLEGNFVFLGIVVRCAHSLFWFRRIAASLR